MRRNERIAIRNQLVNFSYNPGILCNNPLTEFQRVGTKYRFYTFNNPPCWHPIERMELPELNKTLRINIHT